MKKSARPFLLLFVSALILLYGCSSKQVNPAYTNSNRGSETGTATETYPAMIDMNIPFDQLNVSIKGFETVSDTSTGVSTLYVLFLAENIGKKAQSISCHDFTLTDALGRKYELATSFEQHFSSKTAGTGFDIQPGLAQYIECSQQMPMGTKLTNLSVLVDIFSEPNIYNVTK